MRKTKIIRGVLFISVLMIASTPFLVGAQPSQIVPGDCNTTIGENGTFTDPCGWTHFVQLANNILQFLVYLSVPIAAVAFVYAGWLYLSSQGNPGQISRAHGIFLNVAIGLIIVLVSWLVVDLILTSLATPGSYLDILSPGN